MTSRPWGKCGVSIVILHATMAIWDQITLRISFLHTPIPAYLVLPVDSVQLSQLALLVQDQFRTRQHLVRNGDMLTFDFLHVSRILFPLTNEPLGISHDNHMTLNVWRSMQWIINLWRQSLIINTCLKSSTKS